MSTIPPRHGSLESKVPAVFACALLLACAVDAADADAGGSLGATPTDADAEGSVSATSGPGDSTAGPDSAPGSASAADSSSEAGTSGEDGAPGGDDSSGGDELGVLPPKIIGGYWQMWQGPSVAEITANAPEYNLQYAAFALGTSPGTGSVSFDPVFSSPEAFAADMAASQAAGSLWLLSIGGGGEQNIELLDEQDAAEMVDSLVPVIDAFGFDGIDFDLESGPEGWSVPAMKSVAVQLEEHYGAAFIISAAPRPYEDQYRDWAVEMGDTLDLFGYQFYDAPEFNDPSFLRDNIAYRVGQTVDMGVPASKILIGCITYSQYPYGHNTVEVYRDIVLELEQQHPDLRGVFIWETSLDLQEGWSFAHVMGEALLE